MSIQWLPCGPWPAPIAGLRCGRASPRDFALTLSSGAACSGDLAIRYPPRHPPNLRRNPPRLRSCRPTTPNLHRRRAASLLSMVIQPPFTPGNATTASPAAGAPTASRANQPAKLRRSPLSSTPLDSLKRRATLARPDGAAWGSGIGNAVDLDLDDIQGNIVPGFNKDHQAFLLIRFRGRQEGASWLRELQPLLTSANEVEGFRIAFKSAQRRRSPESSPGRDGGALRSISATWTNVAISFAGLRVLAGARNVSRFPLTFRSNRVPAADQPEAIADADALLIVGADHVPNLEAELERQRQRMAACGV